MKFLKILLGILMIFTACSILTIPALSSVAMCWILSFFMLVSGIVSIIRFIEGKNAEKVAGKMGIPHIKTGIGSLIFGIVSIVISILARSSVIGELVFIRIISVIFGVWIVLDGISMIAGAIKLKRRAIPGWLAIMLFGILLAFAGVFCIVDCFTALTAVGVMFGISMMMAGVALIFGDN